MSDLIQPRFRHSLKAKIISSGYRSLTDFCADSETDLSMISKIVCGWQIPGKKVQGKMAAGLGISLKELRELLI